MGKFIDRTGHVFGRLTVVARDITKPSASKGGRVYWICKCECGQFTTVTGHELSCGDTSSCGCIKKEKTASINRTHGMAGNPTYRSWQAMKERCFNLENANYPSYGEKGISVCYRWNFFEFFLEDMGERPQGTTLDRINPFDDYKPSNCRWATTEVQSGNRRTNILFRGELLTKAEIARRTGVRRTSLNKLIYKGMSAEDAVSHLQSL